MLLSILMALIITSSIAFADDYSSRRNRGLYIDGKFVQFTNDGSVGGYFDNSDDGDHIMPQGSGSIIYNDSPIKSSNGSTIQFNVVWSLISTNNGTIFFLNGKNAYHGMGLYALANPNASYGAGSNGSIKQNETGVDYSKQSLKRYNLITGETTTVKSMMDMTLSYNSEKLKNYRAYKLVYDSLNDKVYMSGKYATNNGKGDYRGALYQVYPEFKLITADPSFNFMFGMDDSAIFDKEGNMLYTRKTGKYANVYKLNMSTGKSERIMLIGAPSYWNDDVALALADDGYLYMLLRNYAGTKLFKYPLYIEFYEDETVIDAKPKEKEWELVKFWENSNTFDMISTDGSTLYMARGYDMHKVGFDGTVYNLMEENCTVYSGKRKANFNSGDSPLYIMNILPNGNIIYVDTSNHTIRKISVDHIITEWNN